MTSIENVLDTVAAKRPSIWADMRTNEDWWAVWCGTTILLIAFAAVWLVQPAWLVTLINQGGTTDLVSPLASFLAAPGKWTDNPMKSFTGNMVGIMNVFLVIGVLFAIATKFRGMSVVVSPHSLNTALFRWLAS